MANRKTKARGAMLENCGRDPEGRLATDQAVDNPATADRLLNERSFQTELRRSARERGIDFGHHKGQIGEIAIDKIPTIAEKLVMHVVDEAFRSKKADRLLASDSNLSKRSNPIKWSICAWETKTCSSRWRSNRMARRSNSVST